MPTQWSDHILVADLEDEPALSEELAEILENIGREPQQSRRGLLLNFDNVSYINSSNIAHVLRLQEVLESAGGRLVLCCVGDQVWSVFLSTGLDRLLDFAPNTASALASLQLDSAGPPE